LDRAFLEDFVTNFYGGEDGLYHEEHQNTFYTHFYSAGASWSVHISAEK